ncbi:MAG: hypothetical protein JWM77_3920 [Rhodospirillales bacterium]|jgi:hypothetical protein|nr:hypothetical protein [Rhodospirillales bacterium]
MRKNVRWLQITAVVSALWLVGTMAVVGSRIQTQVESQRAIELELADGAPAAATPGFLQVARCMMRYGGWQLAEVGGAPVVALLLIGVAGRYRSNSPRTSRLRRATPFRDDPERI